MDNTDVKRRVVLVRSNYNNSTGERTISVKPKPLVKRKVVVASGYRSSSKSGHTVGDVLTAKVLPFRFAIKSLLNKRGIYTQGLPFKTLLVKFYNEFSGKKLLDESSFINNVSFKLKPSDNPTGDITNARNQTAFIEVSELANFVINIFKIARAKYQVSVANGLDPNQLLKDEELTMAKAVFMVERSLIGKTRSDNYIKTGELRKTIYWLVGFGLVLYIMSRL